MRESLRLVLWMALAGICTGVKPDTPRGGVIGAKGLATTVDCTGAVGFSATGTGKVHDTRLISYRTTLVDRGVGFSRETGEFTVHCPGIYHIAFAAYSDTGSTLKTELKKRTTNETWISVAGAGGKGGGSNQVLLALEVGDQTGVWLSRGEAVSMVDEDVPTTTFTAFRIAKK